MRRTFTFKEDPNLGGQGFMPDFIEEAYAAGEGRMVAHDALEHPPFMSGRPVESELMAFGAIIRGRYSAGMLSGGFRSSVEQSLGEEMGEFFRNLDRDLVNPGVTRACDYNEEMLSMCKHAGEYYLRQVWPDQDPHDEDRGEGERRAKLYEARMIGWLRKGYRWAQRTYGDWCLASAYTRLAEKAEPLLHDNGEVLTGDRLVVNVKPKDRSITLTWQRNEGYGITPRWETQQHLVC